MYDRDNDGGLEWWQTQGQFQWAERPEKPQRTDMGLIIRTSSSGKAYEPAPPGLQPARCIQVIDLGTQTTTFSGETKQSKRVQLTWEIPGERMSDGRPFTISKKYSASLNPKSTLCKDLEGWRNKVFTEAERAAWDTRKLLGQACTLTIIHSDPKPGDDRIYARVQSIGPVMKGMEIPKAENELLYFDLDEFDEVTFNKLSKYLQEAIASSPEYQAIGAVTVDSAFEDSDIPF